MKDSGYSVLRDVLPVALSVKLAVGIEHALGVGSVTPDTDTTFAHGVCASTPLLWPLLDLQPFLRAVHEVIGEPPTLLPAVDTVAVNGSERDLHRDSSYDALPSAVGADDPRYGIVRALAYPAHDPATTNEFLVVPGSHKPGWVSLDNIEDQVVRIPLRGRDVVLFDARLIHAGGAAIPVTKHMLILTFGPNTILTWETCEHERANRLATGAPAEPPAKFVDALKKRNLLPDRIA